MPRAGHASGFNLTIRPLCGFRDREQKESESFCGAKKFKKCFPDLAISVVDMDLLATRSWAHEGG